MMRTKIILIFLLCCTAVNAQEEIKTDTLGKENIQKIDSLSDVPTGLVNHSTFEEITHSVHPFRAESISTLNQPLQTSNMELNLYYPTHLAQWQGGILTGGHGEERLYGIGAIRYAGIMASQELGRFKITGNLTVEKFNFYRNVGNELGGYLSGTYTFNRNISATAFGSMQNIGFMGTSLIPAYQYGGFFSFTTNNNKWGLDLGAQRYFNPYTRQWTTVPIAMPYYKFGEQKLGVDLGGLIYNIFINAGENISGGHTIKPMPKQSSVLPPPARR